MYISPISKPGILILLTGIAAKFFGGQLEKIPLVGKGVSGVIVPAAKIIILVGVLLCVLALFRYLYAKNPKLAKILGLVAIVVVVAFYCIKKGKLVYLVILIAIALTLFLVSKFLKKGTQLGKFRTRPSTRKAEPAITIEDVQSDTHNYTKKMNEF